MKPMLASDWDEDKVEFPCILQPKIDGVRSLNTTGVLSGRSLKQHANTYTTAFFSRPEYQWIDGEMAAQHECHPELCRLTSSALSTIEGQPFILWWAFDYLHPEAINRPYIQRLTMLHLHVESLHRQGLAQHLRAIPYVIVNDMEELLQWDNHWLEMGYEGSIKRAINGKHKQGRSTVREGGLLRIKRFLDFEFVVTRVTEGQRNMNPAEINELGNTFRSTHQENMVPNGMVGNLIGNLLADVVDPQTGKVLHHKDEEVTVSAGCMPHDERALNFREQHRILGRIGKGKLFPKGVKDKPRFATFQSWRSPEDM